MPSLPTKPTDPPVKFGDTGTSVEKIQQILSKDPDIKEQIKHLESFGRGFSFFDKEIKGIFEKETRLYLTTYQKRRKQKIREIGEYTEGQFQNILGIVEWATWKVMSKGLIFNSPETVIPKKEQPPTNNDSTPGTEVQGPDPVGPDPINVEQLPSKDKQKEREDRQTVDNDEPFDITETDLFDDDEEELLKEFPELTDEVDNITEEDILDSQITKEEEQEADINYKKNIDQTGLPQTTKQYLSETAPIHKADALGVFGDKIAEGTPKYISAPSERVHGSENGALIVMGRDRTRGRNSGYGGLGDTQAASIDIVTGLQGSEARSTNKKNEQLWADKDFEKDAARIYLSQKTDIDDSLNIVPGKVGTHKAKSAVGIKADSVRVVGRSGIKIVTGTDEKNSQGGHLITEHGIDLIGGNKDDELAPIPKGDNLLEALQRLTHHIDKLAGIVDALVMVESEFGIALTGHFHNSPFFGAPTTPSQVLVGQGIKYQMDLLARIKKSIIALKSNLATFKISYLSPAGSKYVNSRRNNTN